MIEITAEIRALIDKAAAGMELAEDDQRPDFCGNLNHTVSSSFTL